MDVQLSRLCGDRGISRCRHRCLVLNKRYRPRRNTELAVTGYLQNNETVSLWPDAQCELAFTTTDGTVKRSVLQTAGIRSASEIASYCLLYYGVLQSDPTSKRQFAATVDNDGKTKRSIVFCQKKILCGSCSICSAISRTTVNPLSNFSYVSISRFDDSPYIAWITHLSAVRM